MTNTLSLDPNKVKEQMNGFEAPKPGAISLNAGTLSLNPEEVRRTLTPEERPKGRTKEDILADPQAMDTIRRGLISMYGERKSFVHSNFDEMEDDELFETWQNWNRRFAVGNSVTTSRTALKAFNGDDSTKAALDENFRLFDSMESGFKGDFWDTVWDYGSGAIVDPLTIVSLGVGKALSSGGTKAGAVATRQALKQTTSIATKQAVVRQGLAAAATEGAKTALRYSAFDIASNLALDAAYQRTRMEVGTQEEYSAMQTMIAGAASAGIPAILGASAGARSLARTEWAKGTPWESYTAELANHDLTKEGLMDIVKKSAPRPQAQASVKNIFKNLKGKDGLDIISWNKAKEELPQWLANGDRPIGDGRKTELYFNQLFFGNKNGKGFVGYLIDEKIPFDKKLFADEAGKGGTSGFIYSTFDLLDDKTVAKLADDFEDSFGAVGGGLPRTTEELKSFFTENSSLAGTQLNVVSRVHHNLRVNAINNQMDLVRRAEEQAAKAGEAKGLSKAWEWGRFGQGVWKRLLTSHPATTGANVTGWGQMYFMNTASDLAMGLIDLGEAAVRGFDGDVSGAQMALKSAGNSVLASTRRMQNLLNWDDTIEAADHLINANPDMQKVLNQVRTGDAGVDAGLEAFGLEGSKIAKGIDKTTEFAQALTGVKLQDEITKKLSFISALDTIMLRRKGMTMGEFMRTPGFQKEMLTPEFREEIMGYAIDRAMRETASRSFADYGSKWFTPKGVATGIETFSQQPLGGVLIPFGRFFNNTMAMFGDFSGINAARYYAAKAAGKPVDYSTKGGQELLANAMVGITFLSAHADKAMARIEQGLAWNQEARPDGSVSDRQYDWPGSAFRLAGQLWAHRIIDGEVPAELAEEASKIYVTQSLKDVDSTFSTAAQLLEDAYSLDASNGLDLLTETLAAAGSRFISGGLRPLDPINEGVKFFKGTGESKDRRENFSAQAFRYVDGIFGFEEDLESKNMPIGGEVPQDISKQFFGSRTADDATEASNIANSLGIPLFKAVRWDGEPELKNRLDGLMSTYVEINTASMLEAHPEFDDKSYADRRILFKRVLEKSKKQSKDFLKTSMKNGDKVLRYYDRITQLDKKAVKYVKEDLGIDQDLVELAKDPAGWEQLEVLFYLIENWEDDVKYR